MATQLDSILTKSGGNNYTPVTNVNFTGDITNNYFDEYWVGVVQTGVIKWLYLGDGITTITPKYTDKKKTAAYYNGGGQENSTITGVTESYDVQGDRSVHNPAQDLIARMKRFTGARRQAWFRKNSYTESSDSENSGFLTLVSSEYGMATFSDIDDGGGAADDNGSFKFTVTYNGVPTSVEESNITTLNQILLQTPCQNATILGVPLKQPTSSGKFKIFRPDLVADTSNGDVSLSKPASLDEARELAFDKDELEGAVEDTGVSNNMPAPTAPKA